VFPILSEIGPIDIPLVCTCKKALVSVKDPKIDFGQVIYGEQATKSLHIKNLGALPTRIYMKTPEGYQIPFVNQEELVKRIDDQNNQLIKQQTSLEASKEKM
jgi:hypothetical protein